LDGPDRHPVPGSGAKDGPEPGYRRKDSGASPRSSGNRRTLQGISSGEPPETLRSRKNIRTARALRTKEVLLHVLAVVAVL
jgi:hypothetical protein